MKEMTINENESDRTRVGPKTWRHLHPRMRTTRNYAGISNHRRKPQQESNYKLSAGLGFKTCNLCGLKLVDFLEKPL